jgi:hypothetical protein
MDTATKIVSWFAEAKKQAFWMFIAMVFGFGLGKVYTWDAIATDCKVLGTFRIAYTPFHCKMMTP